MKKLFIIAVIIFMFTGCKQATDWSSLIQGAYSMEVQSILQDGKETAYKDLNQLKIYTSDHFMYTQLNPGTGVAAFGVGSFEVRGDTIVEHSIYSSQGDVADNSVNDFKLLVNRTPRGYKQIINEIKIKGKPSVLTEFYTRTGNDSLTTPLDGVWKETRSYQINGQDTTFNHRTQYKAFFRGQFMFGSTDNPDTDSLSTAMGYGTFKVIDDGKLEETDLVSSYGSVAGFTFPVDYTIQDETHFVQKVHNQDGTFGVEYYEKVQ